MSCNLVETYLCAILCTLIKDKVSSQNSFTLTKEVAGYFETKLTEIPQVKATHSTSKRDTFHNTLTLAVLRVPHFLASSVRISIDSPVKLCRKKQQKARHIQISLQATTHWVCSFKNSVNSRAATYFWLAQVLFFSKSNTWQLSLQFIVTAV
jgi:hypothetical protein